MADATNLLAVIDNYIREIVRDELAKASPVSEFFDGSSFSEDAAEAILSIAQGVAEKEMHDFEPDIDDAVREYFWDNLFKISPH